MPSEREVFLYKCECGSNPRVINSYGLIYDKTIFYVVCSKCKKSTKEYRYEKVAVKAWNEGRYVNG